MFSADKQIILHVFCRFPACVLHVFCMLPTSVLHVLSMLYIGVILVSARKTRRQADHLAAQRECWYLCRTGQPAGQELKLAPLLGWQISCRLGFPVDKGFPVDMDFCANMHRLCFPESETCVNIHHPRLPMATHGHPWAPMAPQWPPMGPPFKLQAQCSPFAMPVHKITPDCIHLKVAHWPIGSCANGIICMSFVYHFISCVPTVHIYWPGSEPFGDQDVRAPIWPVHKS